MEIRSVKLDRASYHTFLGGREVRCRLGSADASFEPGDEVIVLKDTAANHTTAGVPTREQQSDYIGIKATVTAVTRDSGSSVVALVKR